MYAYKQATNVHKLTKSILKCLPMVYPVVPELAWQAHSRAPSDTYVHKSMRMSASTARCLLNSTAVPAWPGIKQGRAGIRL